MCFGATPAAARGFHQLLDTEEMVLDHLARYCAARLLP
jgi:hypothetical protein